MTTFKPQIPSQTITIMKKSKSDKAYAINLKSLPENPNQSQNASKPEVKPGSTHKGKEVKSQGVCHHFKIEVEKTDHEVVEDNPNQSPNSSKAEDKPGSTNKDREVKIKRRRQRI